MKKIAIFVDNAAEQSIYARISGLFRSIYEDKSDIALYLFRCRGGWGMDRKYNLGEYNIFRLPDFSTFDGFIMVFNDIARVEEKPPHVRPAARVENFAGAEACREVIERVRATGKPAISISFKIEGFAYVGIDNRVSMSAVVRHLTEVHRCRNFWFLMGPTTHPENVARAEAIRDYLAGWDNKDREKCFYFESFEPSCGVNGFRTMLEEFGSLPDAIVCANDHIAVGALMEAAKHGYQCPRDFLITGFDNMDMASTYSPTLTTIDQNWQEMGRVCIDYFRAHWAGEDFPESTILYTRMIRRQSCGCETARPEEATELFNDHIGRSLELESFNKDLILLENRLMVCESLEDMGEYFLRMMPYLGCETLYLVLDRRFYSEREQTDLLKDSVSGTESVGRIFMTEGYPPEMIVAFAIDNGRVTLVDQPSSLMYEAYVAKPAPKDVIFLPVHFGNSAVGFIALCQAEHLIRNNYLSRAVQMLLAAIENLYIRTRLRGANSLLSRASVTDAMTGFYNRLGYQEVAEEFFTQRDREGKGVLVLFADMDGMKQINDRYGHESGDRAILSIAQAIRRACPQESVVARMGGDEFLILTEESDPARAEALIAKIRAEIPSTEAAASLPYPPALSVGYTITVPGAGKTLDEYVRRSDKEMYSEKKKRKEAQGTV